MNKRTALLSTWLLILPGMALAAPPPPSSATSQQPVIRETPSVWDHLAVKSLMLPREKAVFLNQNLIRCICAGVPDPKNPTSCAKAVAQGDDPNDLVKYPRDCATRTVDPNDDQDWNERLLNAKGEEVTGTYTFEGKRCGGADSNPTETCPIQVKAAFDVQCSPGTTKCVAAQTISAYYSIKLAVEVKGTMTVMQSVRPTTAVVFETGTISSR